MKSRLALIWVLLLAAPCFAENPTTAPTPKIYLNPDHILKAWDDNLAGLDSVELSFHQTTLEAVEAPNGTISFNGMVGVTWFYHRIEQGEKYNLTKSKINYDATGSHDVYDGAKTMTYLDSTHVGSIVEGTTGSNAKADNLVRQYLLMESLPSDWRQAPTRFERLLDGSVFVEPVMEEVNGEMCLVVDCESATDDYTLWIAPDRGMLLMKYIVERSRDGARLSEMEVWEVASADAGAKKIWYPKHAQWISSPPELGRIKYDLQVDSFQPNLAVNADTFKLVFPAGAHVWDKSIKLSYTSDGKGGALGRVTPVP